MNSDNTFVISRAKPMDNLPEKAQLNQKRKLLKNVTINSQYVAENYYQNSMDELMYEKDGTISKMRQFAYKVHKYKPGKTILPEKKEK
jgi:hypothetical protein